MLPLEVPPALQPTPEPTPQPDDLSSGFLKNIPEADRPIVEKYVKDWDSGVTKRFQSIHEDYRPYKELGDLQDLEAGIQILQALRLDPKAFYTQLSDLIKELEGDEEVPDPIELVQPPAGNVDTGEIAQLKAALEDLTGKWTALEQTQTEKAQIAELDKYMAGLHTEHGDFNDEYVLLQMANDIDAVEAIKMWNNLIEANVNSRKTKTAPIVLPGSGTVPGGQVDPSKLDKKDRLAYVTAVLEQAKR
ncbi:hypothetical protein [Caudoviricetes sp.]|nr:hypothetical protein [Caudoviricetes sp.]